MSHTNKDRPYRVRACDPKEDRIPHHDHLRFGKPLYKIVAKKDDEGNFIYVQETGRRFVNVSYDPDKRLTRNAHYEDYTWTRRVYERVLVGYVMDECTLDHQQAGNMHYRWDEFPCGYYLAYSFRNRPLKDDKKAFHGSKKSGERNALRNIIKLANSGEALDDVCNEDLESRVHFHYGYWG